MADLYGKSLMDQKDEDYQEEEVWAVVKEREESNKKVNKSQKMKKKHSSSYAWTSIDHHGHQKQSSAPMRIPDWSKIYREKSNASSDHERYDDDYHDGNDVHGDDDMMPPHEYINRRVASSQIAPFSMCEGVGRTLKGRDLSKVRNAILTKTGFLE